MNTKKSRGRKPIRIHRVVVVGAHVLVRLCVLHLQTRWKPVRAFNRLQYGRNNLFAHTRRNGLPSFGRSPACLHQVCAQLQELSAHFLEKPDLSATHHHTNGTSAQRVQHTRIVYSHKRAKLLGRCTESSFRPALLGMKLFYSVDLFDDSFVVLLLFIYLGKDERFACSAHVVIFQLNMINSKSEN